MPSSDSSGTARSALPARLRPRSRPGAGAATCTAFPSRTRTSTRRPASRRPAIRSCSRSMCRRAMPSRWRSLPRPAIVMLGKLATHEFAIGGPSFDLPWPPARNPWRPSISPAARRAAPGAALRRASCSAAPARAPAARSAHRLPTAGSPASSRPTGSSVAPAFSRWRSRSTMPAHSPGRSRIARFCCRPWRATIQRIRVAPISIPDYRAALTGGIKGMRIGVVRHFYERDITVTPEVGAAMEASIGVLSRLGASVRDVTLPPLQDWNACGWLILSPRPTRCTSRGCARATTTTASASAIASHSAHSSRLPTTWRQSRSGASCRRSSPTS